MSAHVSEAVVATESSYIDWDKEIELPVIDTSISSFLHPSSPPRNIVLTGATGFLGSALLSRFVVEHTVERINCVAVRNPDFRTFPPVFHTAASRADPVGSSRDNDEAEAFLDFVDVQTGAEGISSCVLRPSGNKDGNVGYEYQAGEYVMPLRALLAAKNEVHDERPDAKASSDLAAQARGLAEGFTAIPLAEWTERARSAGMNALVVALLDTAVSPA